MKLITFEGIDGGGKTTQMVRAVNTLRHRGVDVFMYREPGNTSVGEHIRQILLSDNRVNMSPQTELLLFNAARAQLVHECIRPHVNTDAVIFMDRFIDSSMAYQAYARGLNLYLVKQIIDFATGSDIVPDLTLYFDLSAETSWDRLLRSKKAISGSLDHFDRQDITFRKNVIEGYEQCIAADPKRFVRIDAEDSFDSVAKQVLVAVGKVLDLHELDVD